MTGEAQAAIDADGSIRVNRYPGRCYYCDGPVKAGAGRLLNWQVRGRRRPLYAPAHLACFDKQAPSVTVVETSGGTFTQNSRGRCEDAPCCGCCTF